MDGGYLLRFNELADFIIDRDGKKVISQHLSTIRGANIIHVIENGRLVESGTWGDLIAKENSRFRELCKAQGIDN